MKRRDFLKTSGAVTGIAIVSPGLLLGETRNDAVPLEEPGPFLELRGNPLRKSCDGLVDYNDASFEEMCEDMVHHRMPEEWQRRYLFEIE